MRKFIIFKIVIILILSCVKNTKSNKMIYIINSSLETVSTCQFFDNLTISRDCKSFGNFSNLSSIAILNDYIYMSDSSANTITVCKLYEDKTISSNCVVYSDFDNPKNLSIYENMLYIVNNDKIKICEISENSRISNDCKNNVVSENPKFTKVFDRFIFILDTIKKPKVCKLNDDYTISNYCGEFSDLINASDVNIYKNKAIFVRYDTHKIFICDFNFLGNEFFSQCKSYGDYQRPFSTPERMFIFSNKFFITNFGNSTISICEIQTDFSLSTECDRIYGYSSSNNYIFDHPSQILLNEN